MQANDSGLCSTYSRPVCSAESPTLTLAKEEFVAHSMCIKFANRTQTPERSTKRRKKWLTVVEEIVKLL